MDTADELRAVPSLTKARAVLCASMCNFMMGAFFFFSNINSYVAAYLQQYNRQVTAKDTLLIIPIYMVCQSMGSITSIRFVNRFGQRWVVIAAYSMFGLSNLAMVFVTSYWTFVFLYGCVMGFSGGVGSMPAMFIPWTYFPEKKSMITGICLFTAGIAASVLSPASTFIVNPDDIKDYQTDPAVFNRVPLLFFSLFLCYGGLTLIIALLQPPAFTPKPVEELRELEVLTEANKESQLDRSREIESIRRVPNGTTETEFAEKAVNTSKEGDSEILSTAIRKGIGKERAKSAINEVVPKLTCQEEKLMEDLFVPQTKTDCPSLGSALKSKHFLLLATMAFSCSIYNFFMNSVWKQFYATKIEVSDTQMAIILSYGSFANAIVRVLAGIIMLKYDFKLIYLVISASAVVSSFSIGFALNTYFLGIIYLMVMFFSLGIQFTIFPVVCANTFGTKLAPSVYPFVFSFFTLANLTQYFLLKCTDNWGLMFNVYGTIAIIGTVAGLMFESAPNWADEQADYQAENLAAQQNAIATPLLLK